MAVAVEVVPLVGIEVAVGVGIGIGARREGADADDAGLDGAAEAVGVGEQRGLGRRGGFDLRGPEAGGDPEREDCDYGQAECAAEGEQGDRDEGEGGEEQKEGGARGCGRKLGEGCSEGEADGGGEQGRAAEAEGLDAGEAGPEAFFPRPRAFLRPQALLAC